MKGGREESTSALLGGVIRITPGNWKVFYRGVPVAAGPKAYVFSTPLGHKRNTFVVVVKNQGAPSLPNIPENRKADGALGKARGEGVPKSFNIIRWGKRGARG